MTADRIATAAAKLMTRHPNMKIDTAWTRARQGELSARALAHPEGLTKYAYTKGMTQGDAMAFWTDAAALGFIKLGRNDRGTNVFGWRSTMDAVGAP